MGRHGSRYRERSITPFTFRASSGGGAYTLAGFPTYYVKHATLTTSVTVFVAQAIFQETRCIATVLSGQVESFLSRFTKGIETRTARSTFKFIWCAACRHLVPKTQAQDLRLGFRGYCDRCVKRLAMRCERLHQRMPILRQEFFCPICSEIKPLDALCPPEQDGRRRLRCRICRMTQLRDRRKVRQQREAAYGGKRVLH